VRHPSLAPNRSRTVGDPSRDLGPARHALRQNRR